jgi:quinol monooxygenase YgiN
LRDEPGTLQFEVLIPREDPDKIMIFEVYADEAAFEVHYNGPSIRQVRQEASGMLLKLYGTRCSVPE